MSLKAPAKAAPFVTRCAFSKGSPYDQHGFFRVYKKVIDVDPDKEIGTDVGPNTKTDVATGTVACATVCEINPAGNHGAQPA
jgi:hypothetical protein